MNSSVSRKRAGGSAISGTSKRQKGSWREELAEDEGDDGAGADKEAAAAPAPSDIRVALGLSEEEEEIMDPGTPLPSEDEKEAEAPAVADAPAAAEASGSSDAAAATAASAVAAEAAAGEPPAAAAEPEAPEAAASPAAPRAADVEAAGSESLNGCGVRATTIWLEVVSGEDGDDERASEPLEVMLREGLRPAVLERLAACMPPGRGAVVNALVPGLVCTFAKHAPLKLPQQVAAEDAEAEPAEAATGAASSAEAAEDGRHAASTNGKASGGAPLPEAYCHSVAGLLTAPRDAPGLALTLGPARCLDATHDVLGPVLLGRRVVQRLGALAPLTGGPAPAKPLSLRAVPTVPVEAPPAGEAAAEAQPAAPVILKTALAEVPVDSRPFLLEETQEATSAEELDALGLDLDTRDAEVQELKTQVFSRERQEAVAAIDGRLEDVERRLQRLEAEGMAGEGREQLAMQGMWLKERIRHLVRLVGKLK